MNGDEMVDEQSCTLPGVRAYRGITRGRRGAVDKHDRPSRKRHGTETGRWQDGPNDQTIDMPVAEIADDPALISLISI